MRAVSSGSAYTYSNGSTTDWSFTTSAYIPGAFNKSSPSNGAIGQSTSPTLQWTSSSNFDHYEYCYGTSNPCSNWATNGTLTSVGLSSLTAGQTYYWNVRAVNSGGTATYADDSTTDWSFTTQSSGPPNDAFGSATVISTLPYTASEDTSNATSAGDDPTFPCTFETNYNTVWYQYTPSSSVNLTIDTFGSSYDTVLGVWTGSEGSLSSVACDDDYNGTLQSQVQFSASGGTTYYIEAASYSSGGGSLTLDVYAATTPGAFNKSSPSNGAVGQSTSPTLQWTSSSNFDHYEYCYGTSNPCSNWTTNGTSTSVGLNGLTAGQKYYWNVRAVSSGSAYTYADGSTTDWSFTTVTSVTDCTVVTQIPQSECNALVALYNSTNGASWTVNTNWIQTDTPCSWYGVTCGSSYVTSISLSNNQLSGSIPSQLGSLTNLTDLELGVNQLSGTIPDLSKLTNLTQLNLASNQLSGSIPDLSKLTNLQNLWLLNNQLSGSIPSQLGSLTNLQTLWLDNNQLSGSIPTQLGSLTNLTNLDLHSNQLIGSIPDLSKLTNLQYLVLYNNQLSGSIPDFSKLTNLQYLALDNNLLSGSIPDLSKLTNLQYLTLDNNLLSGSIPDLSKLTNLQYLYLNNNQLSGSLPVSLEKLTHLQYFYFNATSLCEPGDAAFQAWLNTIPHVDGTNICPSTVMISGNAGVAGATLSYTDGTAKTATSAGNGGYSFTVSYNWSGTVTPSLAGYIFSPPNIPYANVLANQTAQNYTASAITYTISGNAGVAGATLSYTDGTAKTATSRSDGSYSFTVSYNWSGTVTPSNACYTFSPLSISYSNITSNQTSQNYTPTINSGCANINVLIGGTSQGTYVLPSQGSVRPSYAGVNNGPVQIVSTNNAPIIASERVAYTPDGGTTWTSFAELMGLPSNQLTNTYVMPWYNNVDLNSQLRFGNVGSSSTTITVTVGGVAKGSYTLAPSQSTRISYVGLNNGPVVVQSSGGVPIIASERVAYSPDGGTTWTSFSELWDCRPVN